MLKCGEIVGHGFKTQKVANISQDNGNISYQVEELRFQMFAEHSKKSAEKFSIKVHICHFVLRTGCKLYIKYTYLLLTLIIRYSFIIFNVFSLSSTRNKVLLYSVKKVIIIFEGVKTLTLVIFQDHFMQGSRLL